MRKLISVTIFFILVGVTSIFSARLILDNFGEKKHIENIKILKKVVITKKKSTPGNTTSTNTTSKLTETTTSMSKIEGIKAVKNEPTEDDEKEDEND